jgi:predicted RNA methylase
MSAHFPRICLLSTALVCLVASVTPSRGAEKKSATPPVAPQAPDKKPDVVYVPTPQAVVDRMLELAEVKTGDIVYDLGCGDGRIVVTAAKKFGVRAVGYDIDPQRVKEARENVSKAGVGHLVRIEQADIFTLDLSGASVITLYLLPALNVRLMPQLAKLKPGSRIVSHNFDMRGAKPVSVTSVDVTASDPDASLEGDSAHTVYKWIVPWEPEPAGR